MKKTITWALICLAVMATSFVNANQKIRFNKENIPKAGGLTEVVKCSLNITNSQNSFKKGKQVKLKIYRSPVQVVGYSFEEVVL